MSFFNLTMVGRQNTFSELKRPELTLPPITKPIDSNIKYDVLKTKHVRCDKEPNQIWNKPTNTSQEVGWWIRNDSNMAWALVPRHVFPKSEMTSFADKMCLADKSFRMY